MYKVSLLLLLFILTLSRESKASFIFLRFVSFLGENLWCLKGSIAIATKKSYTYPEDMNKRNAINKKCHSATRPLPVGTCGASLAFGNIMNQSNPVFGGHELLVEAGFCPLLALCPPQSRPPEGRLPQKHLALQMPFVFICALKCCPVSCLLAPSLTKHLSADD